MASSVPQCPTTANAVSELPDEELAVEAVISHHPSCPLRATPVRDVLRMGGQMLDPCCSKDWYCASRPVDSAVFLSHNWSSSWRRKYLCILAYSEFGSAVAVTALYLAVITCLTCFGFLPVIDTIWGPSGVWGMGAWPVFSIVLFTGPEIKRLLGFKGRQCFFDRACIPQNDDELKKLHIKSIGAYINQSTHLVACYSPRYLRQLWTVYEISCFLILKGNLRLMLIPEDFPLVFLLGSGGISALGFLRHLPTSLAFPAQFAYPIVVVLMGLILYRSLVRIQQQMWENVKNFSIGSAKCEKEEDRSLVEGNIITLLKSERGLPKEMSNSDALKEFDKIVQVEVPRAMNAAWGPNGIPYALIAGMVIVTNLSLSLDTWAGGVASGDDTCDALANFLLATLWRFTATPLMVAFQMKLTRCGLYYQGCKDLAFTALHVVAAILLTSLLFLCSVEMTIASCKSNPLLVCLFVCHILLCVATTAVFRPGASFSAVQKVLSHLAVDSKGSEVHQEELPRSEIPDTPM